MRWGKDRRPLWDKVNGYMRLSMGLCLPLVQVKMIVIDSVAAVFRLLSDKTRLSSPLSLAATPCMSMDYADRSAQLYRMSSLLSRTAYECACWLVTTNQVTANLDSGTTEGVGSLKIRPALGLAWSNCVCCRIMLRRKEDAHQHEGMEGRQRTMQVVYAPHVSPTSPAILFSIGGGGVGAYV
eukprot:GHVS01105501.1.p1 GENE.GHVS01105501.1~~GHVS01105501.1.p1  ORF type:complete len:182 (+),score=8.10 GHVS01105501.1:1097-1642(+)